MYVYFQYLVKNINFYTFMAALSLANGNNYLSDFFLNRTALGVCSLVLLKYLCSTI